MTVIVGAMTTLYTSRVDYEALLLQFAMFPLTGEQCPERIRVLVVLWVDSFLASLHLHWFCKFELRIVSRFLADVRIRK